tara:strand:- start:206 stop:481 length:276 start_codon:yes stop_codon:yes gene_type:complete
MEPHKVAIFTAVATSAIIFLGVESGVKRRNQMFILVLATSIGIRIGNLFNTQCAATGFNLLGTLSASSNSFKSARSHPQELYAQLHPSSTP